MAKNKFPAPLRLPDSMPRRIIDPGELSDGEALRGFEADEMDAADLARNQI